MSAYSYSQCEIDYEERWAAMTITPGRLSAIDAMARKIIAGTPRYQAAQAATGVPWAFIGVLHSREASCDFRGVLHNGETILGTGRKTRLAPAGRGPFSTWEEAAKDALAIKGYSPGSLVWSIPRCLYEGERFNGFGYRMRGVPSAYLWSGSNQYTRGKYIADSVWSATAVDQQMGIAPLMVRLMQLDPGVSFGAPAGTAPASVVVDDDSMQIQRALNEAGGYGLTVDGDIGPKTRAAIKDFQRRHGLKSDGIAGPLTLAKLTEALRAV
ncbi:peptidoglycan-binding protein [Xanthobacter agilis]|uniref:Lysozyme family protein n=1 Tax=Xanthobacter agilis TaxID=47492 RepID=A0ABU0LK18_XANAG|nr:peptidoglycan-binding protein [Xanthobacter agilis]MDQ0507434.1 lysozyme family protein [Xanthobacter agilis]